MAKYLRDQRNGDLYGWNFEMAKLPYMKEVDDGDDDFTADNTGPDPDYVDPETGFPVAETTLDEDRDAATQAALEAAAAAGEADLTTGGNVDQEEPQYDDDGHMLLGYTAEDEPVFETDEERDARLIAEAPPEEEAAPPKKRKR